MKAISLMAFLGLAISISISISLSSIISPWNLAQAQNNTSPENKSDTRQIINLKDKTITLVNKSTNETISTKPYPGTSGNATTNETNKMIIPGKTGNATTNETNKMIIPGKSGQTGNIGNNQNLSERLGKLAK
jgi:hypothetical protein